MNPLLTVQYCLGFSIKKAFQQSSLCYLKHLIMYNEEMILYSFHCLRIKSSRKLISTDPTNASYSGWGVWNTQNSHHPSFHLKASEKDIPVFVWCILRTQKLILSQIFNRAEDTKMFFSHRTDIPIMNKRLERFVADEASDLNSSTDSPPPLSCFIT